MLNTICVIFLKQWKNLLEHALTFIRWKYKPRRRSDESKWKKCNNQLSDCSNVGLIILLMLLWITLFFLSMSFMLIMDPRMLFLLKLCDSLKHFSLPLGHQPPLNNAGQITPLLMHRLLDHNMHRLLFNIVPDLGILLLEHLKLTNNKKRT